ncbi:helix-turn-helix transcriptional regulator [Rhodococcus ruber]|uniref:helix-turn-helix transcriptional regulator n=1 Tax=Rhodococcus ruber TaxID=1830 RepID=UPI0007CD5DB1|nr:helix-turn-helix transcriptional regulator [Rhodococcus ruber]AWG97172.1 XRE family transcriptional regulator [Rhodococcus ruber]
MDHRKDVHDFLATRRARITPAQAGLPASDDKRRLTGLRREEVATLAGISVDYYARLERGNLRGVSDSVLEALARALRLDDAERAHLHDLARTANATTAARTRTAKTARTPRDPVRQHVRAILAGMTGTPAYVRNARMDILAANALATVLYDGILDPGALPVNLARFVFLDSRSREFFGDWETMADQIVSTLRTEAGRSPGDRALSDLIGELTTRSDEFSTRWARHDVRLHHTTRKTLHNSLVGDIELTGDALHLPGDGLVIIAYSAAPDSPASEQLSFLASWAAQHRSTTGTGHETVAHTEHARRSDNS